jgi:hypothetical protein
LLRIRYRWTDRRLKRMEPGSQYAASSGAWGDPSSGLENKSSSLFGKIKASLLRSAVPEPVSAPTTTGVEEQAQAKSRHQGGEMSDETLANTSGQTLANTSGHQRRSRIKANHERSCKLATQAMWYIAAFFATYFLDGVAATCRYALELYWFWLDIFAYFFFPLQGVFNFCVFIMTRK